MATTHTPTREQKQADYARECRDDYETFSANIARVQEWRRRYARDIIADGIFNDSDGVWEHVLYNLAEKDPRAAEGLKTIAAFDAKHGRGLRIPRPTKDDPARTEFLSDVLGEIYTAYADTGFFLGLAVGMQLGRHALKDPDARKNGGHR